MFLVELLALFFVALVAGGWMMGTMLVVPAQKRLSAATYTEVEQANTSKGKRYYPIVVVTGIILLAILTFMNRGQGLKMQLAAVSLVFLLAGFGWTLAKMLPLNARIDKWSAQTPPSDWQKSRDAWHANHRVRTVFAVAAFILLSTAVLQ